MLQSCTLIHVRCIRQGRRWVWKASSEYAMHVHRTLWLGVSTSSDVSCIMTAILQGSSEVIANCKTQISCLTAQENTVLAIRFAAINCVRWPRFSTHSEVKFSKAASAVSKSRMSGLMVNPSTTIWGIVMGLCSNIKHIASQSGSAYIKATRLADLQNYCSVCTCVLHLPSCQ